MALSNGLAKTGNPAISLNTSVEVDFQPGVGITEIRITLSGEAENLDAAGFKAAAEDAKANCPVSKALAAVPIITLTRRLRSIRESDEWEPRGREPHGPRFATPRAESRDDSTTDGYSLRLFVAQFLGLVGIVLYNWWVWVIVATNLLVSTDEFFSDLEATGRPDATLFQHFDLAAGIVMLVAFLVRGPWGPNGKRKEWRWLLALRGRRCGRWSLLLRLSRRTERGLSQRRVAPDDSRCTTTCT